MTTKISPWWLAASLQLAVLFSCATTHAAQAGPETTAHYVRVEGVASDQLSVDVGVGPSSDFKSLHLVVRDTIVKDRLKQLQTGDRITVIYSADGDGKNVLKVFRVDSVSPSPCPFTRFWVLLASTIGCLLFYWLLSGLHPLRLIVGEDGRYSNSKFQIALWFAVVITTYLATLWLRVWYAGLDFVGGVNIPQNLLLISGMSVLTFGGAKGITTAKVEAARANGITDPKNSANVQSSFLKDLTFNDGTVAAQEKDDTPPSLDFGDFQMLVITLLAVGTYMVLIFNFLGTIETAKVTSLPDVDTTILAAFGLGHGAYLTKKAVGKVGQS